MATLTGEGWRVLDRRALPSTVASLGDGEAMIVTRDSKPRCGPSRHDQPVPAKIVTLDEKLAANYA
ncbi:hypothetical protein [Allokutzneria oryzae]|uniref:Uncharacterized protein n=1 Tax=Allokutzneria oryzae TaxID=1378989 RepID=A0ABV5ZTL6_9PSEU